MMQGEWDSAKAVGTGEFEEKKCGLVSHHRQMWIVDGSKKINCICNHWYS